MAFTELIMLLIVISPLIYTACLLVQAINAYRRKELLRCIEYYESRYVNLKSVVNLELSKLLNNSSEWEDEIKNILIEISANRI